ALAYDPRSLVPVLEYVFGTLKWRGSFGGDAWLKIVGACREYLTTLRAFPLVFADHIVDISHNGGLAWDKGYLLGLHSRGPDTYLAMLDQKRTGSLLEWRD